MADERAKAMRDAGDLGFYLGEMGAETPQQMGTYADDPELRAEFIRGWAAGIAWRREKDEAG